MQALADELLDGQILLREALEEFEKVLIEQALVRNRNHISRTADTLGVHRNTVAKKVAGYNGSLQGPSKVVRSAKKSPKR